jgi:translation initiation factor IF-2
MNDRVRIYELARSMGIDVKDLITACRELGIDVKSHSSTVDKHQVGLVIAHLGKKKQAVLQAEQGKPASKTTPGASTHGKSGGKSAPTPPPAPVKPRVLARYRRPDPAAEVTAEVVADHLTTTPEHEEAAPAATNASHVQTAAPIEAPPTSDNVQSHAVATTPPPAKAPAEDAHSVIEQAEIEHKQPSSHVAQAHQAPPEVELDDLVDDSESDEPSAPAVPKGPSRAMMEQQRQLEEIAKANEVSRRKQVERERALAEQAERAKNPVDKKWSGNKDAQQKKTEPNQKPDGEGKPARDPAANGRPMSPSGPAQPIRIAAPSFRATPPRPPKSHNRQPTERHQSNQQKREDKRQAAAVVEVPKILSIKGAMTVKELAEKMAQPETEVIKRLFMKGTMRTVNQMVEIETIKELALEMGYELASQEDMQIADAIAAEEAEPKVIPLTDAEVAAQVTRPPVVTIMGHVDHGKTSLLDAIRQTKFLLTDAEHGGITQHIGAYHVEVPGEDGALRQIVFLDTPGHEAFTAMRARGAKVTDIAILVVAADDGVMPQTIEAIDHAKAAGVPLIVAINKIDKGDSDPERVLTELMHHNVVPDKFGGDTVTVNVSAKKRIGLDELLEMILLVADMLDLKANPEKAATGSIVEAELSRGKGAIATALVANGTLREGDCIVAGSAWGRVRALFDDRGERVKAAGPSMPVEVLGLKEVPQAGDRFEVVADEQTARKLAEERKDQDFDARRHHVTLESFHELMASGEVKEMDIIVKADVQGTAEAIAEQLVKLTSKEVAVRVLRTASGDISETDVNLAASSNAIIIGFNVAPDANAVKAAEVAGVDIRTYNIIYQIIDDLNLAMQGLLQPIRQEVEIGTAEIRATFKSGKNMLIAGCMVLTGKITRGATCKIERGKDTIYEGKIETLKRFKDDAKEVATGFECGMTFERFNEVIEGDVVRAFTIQEIKRELTR